MSRFRSSTESSSDFYIGDRVLIDSIDMTGTLKFLGETDFKEGVWAGIQLDHLGSGKNDGSVQGIRYFNCPPQTGLFVLASKISPVDAPSDETHDPHKDSQTLRILESQIEQFLLDQKSFQEQITALQNSLSIKDQKLALVAPRIHQLEETIDELKKAGVESLELYEMTVEMNRVDREALLSSLAEEKQKVHALELECTELRQVGLDTIEAYEASLDQLKKSDSAQHIDDDSEQRILKLEQENKRLEAENNKLQQSHKDMELECLKLMEEVEQLHQQGNMEPSTELLEEKIEQLSLNHSTELRKANEKAQDMEKEYKRQVHKLNQSISELERLMESNVFKETDLEEALAKERKQVQQLQAEIEGLKQQTSYCSTCGDQRPYCVNCDEFDTHFTHQCPHQDETF